MSSPTGRSSADGQPGDRLVVALVRGFHGVLGAVRLEVLTDRPAERFRPGQRLHREGSDEPLSVVEARPAEPGWVVRFAEVPDRAAAESLRGAYLEAILPRGAVLAEDEHWWHEVIGSSVRDPAGTVLGQVADLYRAGGAEVLVVDGGPAGRFEAPVARPFVQVLDPAGVGVVVDPATLDLGRAPGEPGEPGPALEAEP
jgi:16S rRNA processing protein RimM